MPFPTHPSVADMCELLSRLASWLRGGALGGIPPSWYPTGAGTDRIGLVAALRLYPIGPSELDATRLDWKLMRIQYFGLRRGNRPEEFGVLDQRMLRPTLQTVLAMSRPRSPSELLRNSCGLSRWRAAPHIGPQTLLVRR